MKFIHGLLKPCIICGKLTDRVEIYSEAHICSEECEQKLNDIITEYESVEDGGL